MTATVRASEAWWMGMERKERELTAGASFNRRQRESSARWRSACAWVTENLPDLVDGGEPCPFAVYAAQDLKRLLGSAPSPEQVREYRRQRWTYLGAI